MPIVSREARAALDRRQSSATISAMWKTRIAALCILLAGFGIGYFVVDSELKAEQFPFKLGLDLAGGTHLVYRADTSELSPEDIRASMQALRDVIERRVNLFGVAEPVVHIEQSGIFSGVEEERLIVELPGVTDTGEAVRLIGETPLLEFKLVSSEFAFSVPAVTAGEHNVIPEEGYLSTGLTGRQLDGARLEFGSGSSGVSNEPVIRVDFNAEGAELFGTITRDNVGGYLAIFLDGVPISIPVIQTEITGGTAIITGQFTPEEGRQLARDLDFGALPVPIELISTQTIGASLGEEALSRGVQAGVVGLSFVALFMLLWYRLPGLVAIVALAIYIAFMLAIFKLVPVVLTAAGLAGFILSIGLAVDANVLIFERMKEELMGGKQTRASAQSGFARAWLSIRDGNLSSIITAIILFWFGTSIVEGFALVFGLGVIVSMRTAITVTRTLLYALGNFENRGIAKFLFGTGFKL